MVRTTREDIQAYQDREPGEGERAACDQGVAGGDRADDPERDVQVHQCPVLHRSTHHSIQKFAFTFSSLPINIFYRAYCSMNERLIFTIKVRNLVLTIFEFDHLEKSNTIKSYYVILPQLRAWASRPPVSAASACSQPQSPRIPRLLLGANTPTTSAVLPNSSASSAPGQRVSSSQRF